VTDVREQLERQPVLVLVDGDVQLAVARLDPLGDAVQGVGARAALAVVDPRLLGGFEEIRNLRVDRLLDVLVVEERLDAAEHFADLLDDRLGRLALVGELRVLRARREHLLRAGSRGRR